MVSPCATLTLIEEIDTLRLFDASVPLTQLLLVSSLVRSCGVASAIADAHPLCIYTHMLHTVHHTEIGANNSIAAKLAKGASMQDIIDTDRKKRFLLG
jgi:hypothetical protein